MLRAAGHRATLIEPGRRAVQAILDKPPDLLIGSPGVADLRLVVHSVRQGLGNEIAVMVLTGHPPSETTLEADEILREPLDPAELEIRVGGLLRGQAERRQLQRKVQELLGLYKISFAFSLAGGPEALFGHLSRQSAEVLRAQKGVVFTFDAERRQMYAQAPGFGIPRERLEGLRYTVDGEARSRWNFLKNGPLISNKAQADTRLMPELVAELELQSVMLVPMMHGRRIQGLLLVGDRTQGAFTDEDLSLLLAVAGEASGAVENLRLHEEIKRKNVLLQEYDRLKSEFVAIVAHDFRKPLMAIRGFAELVLEEPDIAADARQEFMRTVIKETENLAHLADDTLLITRMETGEFQHRWSEVDLGPFILEAVPLGLSDHSVLMDIPPGFPRIVADPDRLRQVLNNLTSNAVKYSPNGGSIIVRCRERGSQHVVIEVIDHGIGIPQDQIDRLFQKFQRVRSDEHMRISGTGLGLYICRLIVEGHGGQVWVESEMGKGSTFGLVLPLDARQAAKARQQEAATPPPRSVPEDRPPSA
jgi:signal transduction histidine kinase